MLPPDCAPSSIPEGCEEVLEETVEPEGWPSELLYSCVISGEVVGARRRREDGSLIHERSWRNDAPNGWEREWDNEGRLTFEGFRINGAEHGVCRQWYEGRLLGWYVMDHGTGLDLWRDGEGHLQEERYLKGGGNHGFERWWGWESGTLVWWERHFHENVEHGSERQWNGQGRLKRGFPRYLVNGERVTKRQYLKAAESDPTLPPYRPEDDRPERPLPAEYFATMPPAVPPFIPVPDLEPLS